MCNRTCTTFDFHHVEQMVTKKLQSGGLGGSMGSVKCGFRLECFSTLMFLLTNIVAAFVFSEKKAEGSRYIERRFWFAWSTSPS